MIPLRAFVLGGLGLLCGLQAFALLRAPDAWLPSGIAVHLQPGESVILGRRELAAPQADSGHIELLRTAAGDWQLRNLSSSRAPLLSRDGADESLATTPLAGLSSFRMGGSTFAVVRADARQAEFLLGDERWRYDGATVYRNGSAQPACPDTRWPLRMVALWNRAAPQVLAIARPLQFGGNLHCGNRIGIPAMPPDGAAMSRSGGQLRLTDTARAPRPLAGVQTLSLGQTRYALHAPSRDTLTLSPSRRVALFPAAEARLPPQVSWSWQVRTLWSSSAHLVSAATLVAALALALALTRAPAISRATAKAATSVAVAAAAGGLLIAGVCALLAQRSGHPPAAAMSLLLATLALTLWLAIPVRINLATACALLLIAAGLLAQLELGLGAGDTSWLRYYQKTTALLAIGSSAAALWRLAPKREPKQRTIEYLRSEERRVGKECRSRWSPYH